MSAETTRVRGAAVVAGVALLAVGAAAGWFAGHRSSAPATAAHTADSHPSGSAGPRAGAATPGPTPPGMAADGSPGSARAIEVELPPEMVARAGLLTGPVEPHAARATLRLPGVIAADPYRQTVVTPLVAGRVEAVAVELGSAVKAGQVLARVQSPDVAEARERDVAAQAMLEAHDRELQRIQRLRDIGAASQQELDKAHAEHAAQVAGVETTRARLALLGADPASGGGLGRAAADHALFLVRAPSAGQVTARAVNPGQNVETSMAIFTISDLSTVWVMADVYERDLAAVRVGQAAVVRPAAFPGRTLTGRVSFIDPQVKEDTRTTRVRVTIPNPRGELRPGMFADVEVTQAADATRLTVPASAVQTIGDGSAVYVVRPGRADVFEERTVKLGGMDADRVVVDAGLSAGETVVTGGAFFLRAEVERRGLRAGAPVTPSPGTPPAPARPVSPVGRADAHAGHPARTIAVRVTGAGFEPSRVAVPKGTMVRLLFTRAVEETCAKEVLVPSLGLRRALPLGTPVAVDVPAVTGEVAFLCGDQMHRGAVVVAP